jgi:tetratricopeptide (TPR) repeat protein
MPKSSGSDPVRYSIVEEPRPLSESSLWVHQTNYFETRGPMAWARKEVPFGATTNRLTAHVCAAVIEGFLQDCQFGSFGEYEHDEPVYILELGAGSARLGYAMVDLLSQRVQSDGPHFVYVLTDLAASNVDYWLSHPKLRPLFDEGILDAAVFNVVNDCELTLAVSRRRIAPGEVQNPMIAIATYLFDVIPQDLFSTFDGNAFEYRVALAVPSDSAHPAGTPTIGDLRFVFSPARVRQPRYQDAAINGCLEDSLSQTRDFRGRARTRFLFPAAGLRCLQNLRHIASDRLLVLVAERSDAISQDICLPGPQVSNNELKIGSIVQDFEDPGSESLDFGQRINCFRGSALGLAIHGDSFSLPIDIGILASLFLKHGGDFLFAEPRSDLLEFAGLIIGDSGRASTLRSRYRQAAEELFRALMLIELGKIDREFLARLDLGTLVQLISMMKFDVQVVANLRSALMTRLIQADESARRDVAKCLAKSYETHFPIGRGEHWGAVHDIALMFSTLFAACGEFERSLACAQDSLKEVGETSLARFAAATALTGLGRLDAAAENARLALKLNRDFFAARQLLDQLQTIERPEGSGFSHS